MTVPSIADSAAVAEITYIVGTGPYILAGAIAGIEACFPFSAAHVDGDTVHYHVTDGANVEFVIGIYSAATNSLSRDTVIASSNGGNKVVWTGRTRPIVRETVGGGGSGGGNLWAPVVSLAGPTQGGRLPNVGEELFRIPLVHVANLPINLAGSIGKCTVAPTSTAVFHLYRNAILIGTATFAAGAFIATFSFVSAVSFAISDTFSFLAPSPQDPTLADFSFAFFGNR